VAVKDGNGSGRVRRNFLIGLLIASICALILVYVPKWQLLDEGITDPKTRIELENKLRATLSQILGGAFVLIGVYFAWRRIAATERAVEVSQQGQITERFTRAIDQLGATNEKGNPKLEIRFGGIYALERIAKESKENHWPIMEVLTTYVRENATWTPKVNQTEEKGEGEAEGVKESTQPKVTSKPRADIQAILTDIGRRPRFNDEKKNKQLDLSRTDLRQTDLTRAHLEKANLEGAHLEKAFLREAHLEGAFLREAYLVEANLTRAHLEWANLGGAHLEKADLRETDLKRAKDLTIQQLSKVKTLYKAELDPELMEQIKKNYPQLLEEPK
jgi:hypothetical protein